MYIENESTRNGNTLVSRRLAELIARYVTTKPGQLEFQYYVRIRYVLDYIGQYIYIFCIESRTNDVSKPA